MAGTALPFKRASTFRTCAPLGLPASSANPMIAQLAKRYRAFYKPETPNDKAGDYDVTHSSAIYVFDQQGHARLLATPGSSNDEILHDLDLLVGQSS